MRYSTRLLVTSIALILAGCVTSGPQSEHFAHLTAGKAYFKEGGRNTVKKLTDSQLKEVSAFLDDSRMGWKSFSGTHPIAKSNMIVWHADGSTSDISFFSTTSGEWKNRVLIEHDGDETIQNFPESRLKPMHKIVGS
jgi:hypothetical protein